MIIAGIDESNKGQFFQSIFVSISYTNKPIKEIPYLGQSKCFRKKDLEGIDLTLADLGVSYRTKEITVSQLNESKNINTLIREAMSSLIFELKPDVVYVDSHYSDPNKLEKQLKQRNSSCLIIAKHKHDDLNSLVAIASLIAYRAKLERYGSYLKIGIDLGSGNATDPKTVKYIRENYPNIPFLRKNWSLKSVFK